MFELMRSSTLRQLLTRQLPGLGIALVIAELFYKFGSFTLECVAFLATWLVVDYILALIAQRLPGFDASRVTHES